METWKIVLIIALSVLVVAPIIGVIIGKQVAKRKNNPREPVFNTKQRIIFIASLGVGLALITTGFLLPKEQSEVSDMGEFDQVEEEQQDVGGFSDGSVGVETGGGVVVMG